MALAQKRRWAAFMAARKRRDGLASVAPTPSACRYIDFDENSVLVPVFLFLAHRGGKTRMLRAVN
jgi:hypothetical protein